MDEHIESVYRITHQPGSYLIICPECNSVRNPDKAEEDLIRNRKGFNHKLECNSCQHSFTLHQGLMQRRFLYRGLPSSTSPGQISVMPWNPFIPVVRVDHLKFRIGITKRLDISENFAKIYNTVVYEKGTDKDILVEIRFVGPNVLDIVSSSHNEEDIGKQARFTIMSFGTSAVRHKFPVWKELMAEALSLIDKRSYKSSIIQSHVGFEAFLAAFVERKLLQEQGWNKDTLEKHIIGNSRDKLPIAGVLRVVVDQILGIKLIDTDFFKAWQGGTKKLRNALAHGDIKKYDNILSGRGWTEEETAHWVFKTIMEMIYYIRYYEPAPDSDCTNG